MAIKDLFEKPQQILTSEDAETVTKNKVESEDNLDAVLRQKEEFVPYIDHSSASNFAIYGSAEKYYNDALTAIYREYPYDGTAHEKKEYELHLNYLTRYILDNRYPRTNGHIKLATNATYTGLSGSYGNVTSREYIKIVGGPHTASNIQYGVEGMLGKPLYETFKYSNQLASNPYDKAGLYKSASDYGSQLSNLRFNPSDGMTVEFWMKKEAFDPTKTKRETIFDLWNGKNHVGDSPDATSGRFLIELTSSDGGPFRLTCLSGATSLASDLAICSTNITSSKVAAGTWNHYAVSVKSYPTSNETLVKFYVNGDLDKQTTIVGHINEVTGGLNAHLGALQTNTALGGAMGWGLLSASLDEFRYWKEARTSEQIGRFWWTQVDGGTNKEVSNSSLGVYYKFNEGIVQTSVTDTVGLQYDKKVLDYSGRVSNGAWVGYPGYGYNARSTTSAMVESNASTKEFKDPIIYSNHTQVKNLKTELAASGSVWDDQNNASMLNALPTFMREEDEAIGDGTLTNTVQMMGAYFDKIHHLITAMPKVRATSYLTASAKPYPFATHLLESLGMNAPQLFVQANVLESISQRDENQDYTQDLSELKNLIYQNIYNNLEYIYKSKGTEKSIRNIIRCFGVDEELLRLNLYSSNMTYELKDNTRTKTVKKKYVNFNDVDKFDATLYQAADPGNSNTANYITGSGPTTVTASLGHEELLGMTAEAEFIFPIKLTLRDKGYFDTPFTTVSLFGMHTPTKNTLAFDTKDYANFQVQAIKPNKESNHAYFKLTSGFDPYPVPELTSSLFTDVYDNQRWNLSVRIKPLDPVTNFVQDNQVDTTFNPLARLCQNYEVHFYGVNMESGYAEHTFHVSGTMEAHKARDFLRASKRLYAGAHKQDFDQGTLQYSDVKVSSVKYWATFLENEDLNAHASDAENYGVTDPYKNVALQVASLNKWHIPKIDMLALNWTFNNCVSASSDAADPSTDDSYFFVDDASSGSSDAVSSAKYGWLSNIVEQQHSGKGDRFLPPESGDKNPIDVNYVSSARRQLPEVVNTSDAVQILTQDDDKFTREHSIVQHYYAIEKSMYQTISEEMINMFSSIVDFNNLIGEPVNRYRQDYKDLGKLRQLFFERIGNTPNLDKYVEFYKWIDSAVTTVIQNLIPASAEVAAELHNMVESHVLERNKYWTKFPTIEFKQDDPEAGLRGVMELTYDWEHGHHPVDSAQSKSALYWKDRAERSGAGDLPLENDSADAVNSDKEEIRKRLVTHREAKKNSLAKLDGTLYGGREYALRKFTKPYKLETDLPKEIRSGVNFERSKNVDVAKNLLQTNAPLTISSSTNNPGSPGLPTNVMFVDGANIESFKDIQDDLELNNGKRKHSGVAIMGREKEFDQHNNETYAISTIAKVLPATIVSSSVVTGYNKVFAGIEAPGFVSGASITNIHHDFYGQDREVPMQGPFTEKYIGGHQSRHIRLNPGTDDFQGATTGRPEAWRILVGKQEAGCLSKDPGAFGFVGQDYPYPALGKDPVPAAGNILIDGHPNPGDAFTLSDGQTTKTYQYMVEDWGPIFTNTGKRNIVEFHMYDSSAHITKKTKDAIDADLYITTTHASASSTISLQNSLYGAPDSIGNKILGSKGNVDIERIGFTYAHTNRWGVRWDDPQGDSHYNADYGFHNWDGATPSTNLSDKTFTMAMWVSCSAVESDGQGGITGDSPIGAPITFDNTSANGRTLWFFGRSSAPSGATEKRLSITPYSAGDDSLRLEFAQKRATTNTTWKSDLSLTASAFGKPNGGWYHIILSWDNGAASDKRWPLVMVNGVSASTDISRSTEGSGVIRNGSVYSTLGFHQRNSDGAPIAGSMLQYATVAEAAYWDTALKQADMVALCNSTGSGDYRNPVAGTSGHFTGPVDLATHDLTPKYWWRFGDTDGDEIQESGVAYAAGATPYDGNGVGIQTSPDATGGHFTWAAATNQSLEFRTLVTGSMRIDNGARGGTWSYSATMSSGSTTSGIFRSNTIFTGMAGGSDPQILNHNAPKATRYREELIKRPISIKNIRQTTASVDTVIAATRQHGPIGNYTHNYEIVQTAGRSVNDLEFRKTGRADHAGTALEQGGWDVDAVTYRRKLLQRSHSSGPDVDVDNWPPGDPNFWHRTGSVSMGALSIRDNSTHPVRKANKTVIVSRFSAPGGYESMSRGFLDPAHEEYSPYDVITFRNRAVRGDSQYVTTSGSVPESFKDTLSQDGHLATVFRVVDIHGEPWGLRSHLARYTAPFGRDSVLSHGPVTVHDSDDGTVDYIEENVRPGYHKTHRNRTIANNFTTTRAENIINVTNGVQSRFGVRFRPDSDGDATDQFRLVNNNLQGLPSGGTAAFTVSLWLNQQVDISNPSVIFQLGCLDTRTINSNRPIVALKILSNEKLQLEIWNNDTTVVKRWITAAAIDTNKLLHVMISYDGASTSADPMFYIDGTLQNFTTSHNDATAAMLPLKNTLGHKIHIGGGNNAGTWMSAKNLTIYEAALWSTNLTGDQMLEVYANDMMPNLTSSTGGHPSYKNGVITSTSDLVSWWRMGDHVNDPIEPPSSWWPVSGSEIQDVKNANTLHVAGNAPSSYDRRGGYDYHSSSYWMAPAGTMTDAYSDNYSYYTEHKHDNAYVQHQIPRNHCNYSWITASVLTGHIPAGFPTASNSLTLQTDSDYGWYEYISSGQRWLHPNGALATRGPGRTDRQNIDFVGLNTVLVEPVNTATNYLGWPEGTPLSTGSYSGGAHDHNQYTNLTFLQANGTTQGTINDNSPYTFHALIHNRQGPYGWPSWKQIRGSQNPIVRKQHKKNEFTFVLPDADELHISSSSGHKVIRPRYGNLHYWDRITPVTSKFKPVEATLGVSTQIQNSFGKQQTRTLPIDISTTYGNEVVYFNRDQVDKELNIARNKAASYDEVKAMFTKGALETSVSPVTEINKFVYKEVVYPSHENMYKGDIRKKEGYTNNFWRATHEQRVATSVPTIHGLTFYGRDPSFSHSSYSDGNMSMWPLDEASGAMDNDPTRHTSYHSYRSVFAHGDDHSDLVGKGEGELLNRWSWPIKYAGGTFTFGTGYPTGSTWGTNLSDGGNIFSANRLHPEATACYYLPHMMHATSSVSSPTGLPLVGSSASVSQGKWGPIIIATSGSPAQNVLGIRSTDSNPDGTLYTTEEWNTNNTGPPDTAGALSRIAMQPLNVNSNYAGFIPMQGGYTGWQTGELAGKLREVSVSADGSTTAKNAGIQSLKFVTQSSTPWHESYEHFYNDIRAKAKDYSVLPEFRMEDHMADFINNKGGDFLAEQNSLFRMVGMPSGSSALAANSAEDNFYKIYGTADFLKHFDVLKNDIEEHFEPSALTLECRAMLKFNPYDGFYPAQRTLQLASQFSSSYGKFVDYSGAGLHLYGDNETPEVQPMGETAGVPTSLAFRNFLQPLFAPGIMFNTIKAGIACDWPIMTDGVKIYKTRSGKSDYWALGFPNPEKDDGLHSYLEETYGGLQAVNQAAVKKGTDAWNSRAVMHHGIYKIRDDFRQNAIAESIIVQSASIAGLATGTSIITPDYVYDQGGGGDNAHDGGFYATKVNVASIPGLADTSYTIEASRDPDTLVFDQITLTISKAAGPNLGRWDRRVPFEAIINPENYLKNVELFDYIAHPSCSMDVTASWQGQGDSLYSLMANNFLAAVPDFFLANGNMTTIASRAQDELSLYAQAGKSYGMRIKMYRSLNRERNYANERVAALRTKSYDIPQDPRDDHGLHETFTMYSRASSFGPPVFGRVHTVRNIEDNDGHVAGANTPPNPGHSSHAQALALSLTGAYNLEIGNVFSDLDGEYLTHGTQHLSEVIFHTSSYLAGANGVLDSVEGYYWSHTPPYYHGEAWCDLIFKPQQSKTYSLAEIVDQLEVRQWRVDPGFINPTSSTGLMSPTFIPNGYHSSSLYSAENINANAMQIESSVNLFGIGKVKTYAYSNLGAAGSRTSMTQRRTTGESPAWIIQPKFETPMLNFNSLTSEQGGTCPRPLTQDLLRTPAYGADQVPRGMWHQFGTLPQGNEGVWMSVSDIPQNWLDNHPLVKKSTIYAPSDAQGSSSLDQYKRALLGDTMESLVDFVGMDTTPKRLGNLKEKTTVYEAVVAVPFIEKDYQRWFFTLDPHMVDIALGEETYRLQDGSDTPGDSIDEQIRKMQKYVMPPQLDFLNNRQLPSIAMYIFEFSMTFDKDDLSYMWQNLMPTSATGFEAASATVHHNLLLNELMGYANSTDGTTLKDKISWMVFKVKQKAPTNYYDKIVAKTPELDKLSATSRSKQVALGTNTDSRYSYNWPYDCFSIVEMAQIEATVEFSALPESVSGIMKIDPSGGRASKQGRYGVPLIPNQTPSGLYTGYGQFASTSARSDVDKAKDNYKEGITGWTKSELGHANLDAGRSADPSSPDLPSAYGSAPNIPANGPTAFGDPPSWADAGAFADVGAAADMGRYTGVDAYSALIDRLFDLGTSGPFNPGPSSSEVDGWYDTSLESATSLSTPVSISTLGGADTLSMAAPTAAAGMTSTTALSSVQDVTMASSFVMLNFNSW